MPRSLWPASGKGWTAFLKILFLKAAAPKEEAGKQDGSWLVPRSLGNRLRKGCLGSELTTVNPVSTFVSASSLSKLLLWLRTVTLAPGWRWGEGRCSWESRAALLPWDEQPGLFHEAPLELSDTVPSPGSEHSREATLNLLARLLRHLGCKVLLTEAGVSLEPWHSVSAPELPFRKESSPFLTPGFNWTYGTRKRGTNSIAVFH